MATTASVDLVSGVSLDNDLEDHHIFPRSLRKKNNSSDQAFKDIDSIVNKLIISKSTNRNLSDGLPNEYFFELQKTAKENGIIPDIRKRLKDCLIPGDVESSTFSDQFKVSNFKDFLEKRAEILLKRVEEVIGDSLKASDELDEDME
jgi:hypothetical protein